MKKFIKIAGVIIGIIIVAIAAFVFTFDPNNYKEQITAQVEQHTGRKMEISGDISLSIFPWIGLKIGKTSLGNAPGFSRAAFAKIDQLDIKVKFLPLLKKQIEVDKVRLHGLSVSLETDAKGNNNWSDLAGKPSDQPDVSAKPEEPSSTEKAVPALAGFAINGIEFIGASFVWSDAKTNTHAKISDFDLETGAIRFNQPIPVKLKAQVNNNQPAVKASIVFSSQVRFNDKFDVIDINDLQLNINTLMKEISNEAIALQLGLDAHVDIKQQKAKLSNTRVSVFGVTVNAAFDIENLLSTPTVKGSVSTSEINARELAKKLNIELPAMAGPKSLTSLSVSTLLDTDTKKIYLDDFSIKLDSTRIDGWVHVLDIQQPSVRYSLAMNKINLDDYMPPPAANNITTEKTTEQPADVEIVLPVELLRSLDIDGKFALGAAQIMDYEISKLQVIVKAAKGLVNIDPITMNVLQGQVNVKVGLDVRTAQKFSVDVKANNLNAGVVVDPILKGMLGNQELKLEGLVNFSANVKTHGDRLSVLKKAAKGRVQFNMNKTSVQGVDINHFTRALVADYLAEKSITVPADWRGSYTPKQKTAFNKIRANATIANGVVTNKDLILDSRRLKITGKGRANIIKNTLDYWTTVDLNPPRLKTIAEKALDQPIDIHVYGPFAQPVIEPDTKKMKKAVINLLKAEAKAKVKQAVKKKTDAIKKKAEKKVEQKKEETKQKLKDKYKDKLKGLFR